MSLQRITESLFPRGTFILDHITALGSDPDLSNWFKCLGTYVDKFNQAKMNKNYNSFVLYTGTDGWVHPFTPLLDQLPDVKIVSSCINIPDNFIYLPHWMIDVDRQEEPIPAQKVTPSIRWFYWVRRPRPWRINLLEKMFEKDCIKGEIVFPRHLEETKNGKKTGRVWEPTRYSFANRDLYYKYKRCLSEPVGIAKGENGCQVPVWEQRSRRALELVSETMVYNDKNEVFFSEKTYKAIRAGQLFLILGHTGSIRELKKLGFKVFDEYLDHSYDACEKLEDRIELLSTELKRINDMSDNEFDKIWQATYQDRLHNQTHLKRKFKFWKKHTSGLI